jgi:transcriptional regulator with XRE-family HTH domain
VAVTRKGDGVAKAVGRRVRTLRTAKEWSQERLAEEAGMHRTYMWGIEQGTRNPSLRHLSRLAAALGVSIRTLFVFDEEA